MGGRLVQLISADQVRQMVTKGDLGEDWREGAVLEERARTRSTLFLRDQPRLLDDSPLAQGGQSGTSAEVQEWGGCRLARSPGR